MGKNHGFAEKKTVCALSCVTFHVSRQGATVSLETSMPLSINRDVFITCAVTGAGDTVRSSPHVPVTPKQIADSAIDAAKAGAAIVHCHVRDPETGAASRRLDLYREVTDRIRSADVDVVLNLTAGMGGDLVFGGVEAPLPVNPAGTDMAGATERVAHVAECRPEICTLDCGTMNFNLGDYVMTNTPSMLREMARLMTALGVRPEIEAFDTGHLWFARQLADEGLIESPVLVQLCMGVRWGAPDDLNTFLAMVNNVPTSWIFSAFSIGRNALAYPAAAVLAGGNVRVGLEDNLYAGKGELATNAQLVEKAAGVVTGMGVRLIGPKEVREKLKLTKR
jgi:3-dehydrocarnitine:acetyl-CoA trimethylamine transferase